MGTSTKGGGMLGRIQSYLITFMIMYAFICYLIFLPEIFGTLFKFRLGALLPRTVCLSVLQKLQKRLQNFTNPQKTLQNIRK